MPHVDPDTLALLALGEQVADARDRAHLAECAECAAELGTLGRAASVGRSTLQSGELIEPAPRVWSRISDELGFGQQQVDAPIVDLPARRRRWLPAVAIAASFALVAGVGVVIWQAVQPTASVLATATLDGFPDWPGAAGSATVEALPDGERVVRLDLDLPVGGGPDETEAYTEVWLITSDATRLVSLGTISGARGTLPIPDGVDLAVYDLVDVSAEPIDGDPTHSGDSIVRGQLG